MHTFHSLGENHEGNHGDHDPTACRDFWKNRSMDDYVTSDPSPGDPRTHTSAPGTTFCADAFQATLAKRVYLSCRRTTQPIMYSNSTGKIKPPPIEKKLEYCTLDELCHGCIKEVKITRDVVKKSRYIYSTN
ncbi:hypothetical protein AAG906_040931 [Vitis piasezkii]